MQKHSEFIPIHTILIPFVHEGPGLQALEAARHLDAEIILVGVVVVPHEQSLSIGRLRARVAKTITSLWKGRTHYKQVTDHRFP